MVEQNKSNKNVIHLMSFFGHTFIILLLKKSPKQHGQGNFWENFPKTYQILRKKFMKFLSFLEDLGRFLAFFF